MPRPTKPAFSPPGIIPCVCLLVCCCVCHCSFSFPLQFVRWRKQSVSCFSLSLSSVFSLWHFNGLVTHMQVPTCFFYLGLRVLITVDMHVFAITWCSLKKGPNTSLCLTLTFTASFICRQSGTRSCRTRPQRAVCACSYMLPYCTDSLDRNYTYDHCVFQPFQLKGVASFQTQARGLHRQDDEQLPTICSFNNRAINQTFFRFRFWLY